MPSGELENELRVEEALIRAQAEREMQALIEQRNREAAEVELRLLRGDGRK